MGRRPKPITLRDWFDREMKKTGKPYKLAVRDFAARIGRTPSWVYSLVSGYGKPGGNLRAQIETETGGAVDAVASWPK